jgi:hypothetical protein
MDLMFARTQAEIEDSCAISVFAGTCQSATQTSAGFGRSTQDLSLSDPCTQAGVADG